MWSIWIMYFYVFFCNVIKANHFLFGLSKLLHLVSSFLSMKSLLIRNACVSTESINCIDLSSLVLDAILITCSVNTLCFSLLNIWWDANNNLLFFIKCLWFSLRLLALKVFFLKLLFFYSRVELLLNNFL